MFRRPGQPQPQPRKLRARLVCLQCHSRKLKCDLEGRTEEGLQSCGNCIESSSFCQPRSPKRRTKRNHTSKKGYGASTANKISNPPILPAASNYPDHGHLYANPEQPAQQRSVQSRPQALPFAVGPSSHVIQPHHPAVRTNFPPSSTEQRFISSPTTPTAASAVPPASNADPADLPSTIPSGTSLSYLGDNGIQKIFEPDTRRIASGNPDITAPSIMVTENDLPPPELQQSFAETYFDYCWPWCPVLDKDMFWHNFDTTPSHLLINALALLGTQVRPPIMQHAKAADYYNRAKMLFYTDQESSPIVCLQAIMLFYWWAPRGPSLVHKDAAWWWNGIAIKYAQQVGLHREPGNVEDVGGEAMQGLRRRIWWTLFARERLTAMCQGRPCTINPKDCNIREPSIEDFGPLELADPRTEVFIHWVRLCGIIGRVGQHLSRNPGPASFPAPLANDLVHWVRNLSPHLCLPDMADRARRFDRDVLALHLPYLTTVTIIHLNWSSQNPSQPLPEAYTAAVLSASCVTRIFKDLLARGEIRFLGAIACWHVGVAIVALLHTQRIERLAATGVEDIRILKLALNELARLWPSTDIFVKGFDRLHAFENLGSGKPSVEVPETSKSATSSPLLELDRVHGIDWQSYFPHVTMQTSGLAAILFAEHQTDLWGGISWLEDPTTLFQDLFDNSDAAWNPLMENLSSICWPGN